MKKFLSVSMIIALCFNGFCITQALALDDEYANLDEFYSEYETISEENSSNHLIFITKTEVISSKGIKLKVTYKVADYYNDIVEIVSTSIQDQPKNFTNLTYTYLIYSDYAVFTFTYKNNNTNKYESTTATLWA